MFIQHFHSIFTTDLNAEAYSGGEREQAREKEREILRKRQTKGTSIWQPSPLGLIKNQTGNQGRGSRRRPYTFTQFVIK